MTFLISESALAASRAHYLQQHPEQAIPAPPPAPAPGFTYQPRTVQQWNRRIHQSYKFGTAKKEPKARAEKKPKAGAEKKPKTKAVTKSTPCVCGHTREVHDYPRAAHPPLPASLSTACRVNTGCDCQTFVNAETGKAAKPKPQTSDWTLCATCQHPKFLHCTKYAKGKADRLKPGETPYRILQKSDGTSYGCRHFDPANSACQCDSTGCSATADGVNFCECSAFVNPWLTPKSKAVAKNRVPPNPESVLAGEASANS